jgi:hypothetical protein
MAELSQFSIVTYERRPGHWRAAITPIRRLGTFIQGRTISSVVTPDFMRPNLTPSLQPKRSSGDFRSGACGPGPLRRADFSTRRQIISLGLSLKTFTSNL